MKKLSSLIKFIAFIKMIKPKRKLRRRKRRLKSFLALLNPKRAGKVAYHAGKIRMRHEIKRLFHWVFKLNFWFSKVFQKLENL